MLWTRRLTLVATVLLSLFTAGCSNSHYLHFLKEPQSQLVSGNDQRAVFRCEAAPSAAEIQWLHNGHPVNQNKWLKVSGPKLTILLSKMDNASKTNHFEAHDMSLQCEIRFKGKVLVSAPAKLVLATLKTFPSETDLHISAIAGNTAVIPCDPPYSVPTVVTEFIFNGALIAKSKDNKRLMSSGDLHIFNVKSDDSGEYICMAYNPFLNEKVTSKRKVILEVKETSVSSPPLLLKIPRSPVSIALGRNITFECAASGHPKPAIKWRRQNGKLPEGRFQQEEGNLHLIGVNRGDEGYYICEAENSNGKLETKAHLEEIQETPHIVKFLKNVNVDVGDNLTLNCHVRGHPKPVLKWLHNGKELISDAKKSHLTVTNVHHKHEGVYQCFANNVLGTTYVSAVVTVTSANSSKRGDDFDEYDVDGVSDFHSAADKSFTALDGSDDDEHDLQFGKDSAKGGENQPYGNKRKHKKKHSKGVKLIPPSRPEISRLSNTSVMVRWTVVQGGLPINFFKVQYREVGKKRSDWMTIDEDIAAHIHSYAVTSLRTGGAYRFRIAAVYSNHDNKAGPISARFVLPKDTPTEKFNKPVITFAEAVSPSAITLQWEYTDMEAVSIEGFFIHYRVTHQAGKYHKVTVLGSNTRSHIISHLLPDMGYDIKMQCFNIAGTSDFSNIFTSKTKVSESVVSNRNRNGKLHDDEDEETNLSQTETVSSKDSDWMTLLFMIVGTVSAIAICLIGTMCFFLRREKRNRRHGQAEVPSQENHSKIGNGHVATNGYLPVNNKINISVNPLSILDGDNSEKLEEMEDIVSNNNEIIRLQTFSVSQGPQEQPLLTGAEREANDNKPMTVIRPNVAESSLSAPTEL